MVHEWPHVIFPSGDAGMNRTRYTLDGKIVAINKKEKLLLVEWKCFWDKKAWFNHKGNLKYWVDVRGECVKGVNRKEVIVDV